MSGIEIAGIVLGAFPLAFSAMEHYQETRTAVGSFWRIRRAYRKEVRSVKHCQTIFAAHIEELLQPLVKIEINGDAEKCAELLKGPGGPLWKHVEVEQALAVRLRNRHEVYKDTMEELQILMVKLAKAAKVEDARFQQLLEKRSNATSETQLMRLANNFLNDTGFQARRLKYTLTVSSREALLQEVETYIRRLMDMLSAVDRISRSSHDQILVHVPRVSKVLLSFWRHAERIYLLLRRSMSCNCRPMHCARLWLLEHPEPPANISLLLLFAKDSQPEPTPWIKERLRVRHVDEPGVVVPATTQPSIVVQSASATTISSSSHRTTKQSCKTTKVSFAASIKPPVSPLDLLQEGLCKALTQSPQKQICLGSLTDENDQVQHHVFPEPCAVLETSDVVTAADVLKSRLAYPAHFYRVYRYNVAMKLAAAQIQFHSTQWLPKLWTLDSIRFAKHSDGFSGLDYTAPYILTDFEAGSLGKAAVTTTRDQSFWTLGLVLLELCFGTPLESHPSFAHSTFARNPKDPLQRQAIAHEWAKDVELEAGDDYSTVVKWCLNQSPMSTHSTDWRRDFAQHVLQPLKRCCESMKKRAC